MKGLRIGLPHTMGRDGQTGSGYLGNMQTRAFRKAARSRMQMHQVCQIVFDLLQIKELKIPKQSTTPEDRAKVMGL